jgi:uncharacterized protein (TIGR01777 family)
LRVAVTGSSGLIGSALRRALSDAGHTAVPMVRRAAGADEIAWDPGRETVDAASLAGIDAVVHLAGAGIGDRRWTPARRAEIVRSRVDTTALVARTLATVEPRPAVLVSASAVGIYGNRGDEVLTEDSAPGSGFLADLCRDWEAAAAPAAEVGVRVVHLRSGIVLSAAGGALARQLPLFRLGLGGRLGSGRQWTSWVALEDELRAILFALSHDALHGPVNVTAPTPVTNRDFTAVLGRVLHRPAVLPVPPPAMALVFGRDLVEEVVLASQRALPRRLQDAGFEFARPELGAALKVVLGRDTAA